MLPGQSLGSSHLRPHPFSGVLRIDKSHLQPRRRTEVHADAELKLLDRPIVRRPDPPKPEEQPNTRPPSKSSNTAERKRYNSNGSQASGATAQNGETSEQSSGLRRRQKKNKKYQRNLKLRKAAQQSNGAQPAAEAMPADASKERKEEESKAEESKEQTEDAIAKESAPAPEAAAPPVEPSSAAVKQPAAPPGPATAPAAPQKLEQPQASVAAGLTRLQGPKRPANPEPQQPAVRKPSAPVPQAPPTADAQEPLREKAAGLDPPGPAQAVEERQALADNKQEESEAAEEESEVAEEKIESAEDKSNVGDEEGEAAPTAEARVPEEQTPAEAGPSTAENAAESAATPPQLEAEARPVQLAGLESPQRPAQPLSRPSAHEPPQLRRKPAQAAAAAPPTTEAKQATKIVAPEPSSTAVGGREEEAAFAAPSTSEAVEGAEAVASGKQQPLSSQPAAEEAVELPSASIRGPPPRRVLPRSNTLNMFQRDLRPPPRDSFTKGQQEDATQPLTPPPAFTPRKGPTYTRHEEPAFARREEPAFVRPEEPAADEDDGINLSNPKGLAVEEEESPEEVLSESEEAPLLAAKPIMRRPEPKNAREKPWNNDNVRAFRRMPSEMRAHQFVRAPKDEKDQYSAAWRERAGRKLETGGVVSPDAQRQAAPGRPRQSASRRAKKEFEKQNIEAQRASRQERRQQRQEQAAAEAREQEEIFEVGSEGMSVGELADRLAVNGGDVLKALFMKGIMAQVNQVLDKEMVKMVAEEYGVEVLDLEEQGVDSMARKTVDYADEEDTEFLVPRPPVVTVMGHVDHGKTSLLDYIRKTKVAAGEAGGITQAIGAYTVKVDGGGSGAKQITFLDTPGHEAFSAMRARGTRVTDIAIVVVACDDGVRPQTKEAISHARAAKVPIVVALNKVDKEGANVERAKQELNEAGLLPEEWGGDTPFVPISAKKGQGIDELLETVLLVAEVGELTANPNRMARGSVVEANLDRRMGPVASVLVATGTLRVGDVLHAGACYGKVRSMTDSTGKSLDAAGPSIAVQLVGLNGVPVAGDDFAVLESEQEARKVAGVIEDSQRISRLEEQAGGSMVTSMTLATMDDDGEALQHLNLVLKADASGSVEAIRAALNALPQDRVSLRFLMATAGEITASDVQLAYASEGHVIGFNLEPSESVQAQAKQFGVAVNSYKIIYELISDVRDLMEGRLGTVEDRIPLGEAQVRAVFGTGSKKVAGCAVTEGALKKGCLAVVLRGKRQIHEGKLISLRRVKENVNEVSSGNECGVGVDGFIEWREGDKIEAFDIQSKKQTLEEASRSRATASWEEEEE